MDEFSITQYGKPLKKSLYTIDKKTKVFSSRVSDLVLDFATLPGWTFATGAQCTFKTGDHCTFKAGDGCIFKTEGWCTFYTEAFCIFDTEDNCTFKTEDSCTFHVGLTCTFDTSEWCTFSLCKVDTCKFKSYDDNSIILDRKDKKHYLLTKEFVQLQKVKNG